jgi:hypothetical protein
MTTVGGILLAPIAAVTGPPWIHVDYGIFLLHWCLMTAFLVAMALLLRRRRLLRPPNAPLISWENALYGLTRWPFSAWGVATALLDGARARPVTSEIAPKGRERLELLPARLVAPYVALSLMLSGAALYAESFTRAAGYTFLCLLGATSYSVACLAITLLHARGVAAGASVRVGPALRRTAGLPFALALLTPAPALIAVLRYPEYFVRVFG